MDLYTWLAVVTLLLVTYLAALHLSLIRASHSVLRRRLEERGRADAASWLLDRLDRTVLATSLLATLCRVTFFILVLLSLVGVAPVLELRLVDLVVAGLIAALVLWLFAGVLASAVARFAGSGLIARSLVPLRVLTVIGRPLAVVIAFVNELVRRLAGANLQSDDPVGEELLRSIEDSQLQGRLDADAAELLENVVEFRSTDVGEVMTPRTDIDGLETTDDLPAIRTFIEQVGHSRIPVYRENLDHILGILYVKDLLPYLGKPANDFRLEPLLRQPIRVPLTKRVDHLLADFQRAEVHMAVVIDEYGGTAGLATIEDVLEELVGEIQDEHDTDAEEPPGCTVIDDTHVEVDGRYHIDDFNEQFSLGLPEDEEFDTIGGYLMASLGRVPDEGDTFESPNARFTALDTTPTHVRRIGVELTSSARANGEWESD